MQDDLRNKLMEAKAAKWRLESAENRRKTLLQRKREKERLILQLEIQLESEQADVDALTRMSLLNLFHTLLRSKEEQLELERQQALAAALKLQEAKMALTDIEEELLRIGEEMTTYMHAGREYERLLAEREAALRNSAQTSLELASMEDRLAEVTLLVRELDEARTAGRRVMASLLEASSSLEKAENWGKWDMWANGGMVSTFKKHGHIDDAKQYIHDANRLLERFRDELADLKRNLAIQIDISGMLKMADFWFDGLITDWVVQGRIQNAQEQTLKAIHSVRTVVDRLQAEYGTAETELNGLRSKRTLWIEEAGSN